jgi:hypothetical protein
MWQCSIPKSGFVGPKWQRKIHCSLAALGRMIAFWAQGWHSFDGVTCFGCRRLGEDDGTAVLGTAWVDGIACSGTARGAQRRGLGEDDVVAGSGMMSRAWDGACVVDGVTISGQGRWRRLSVSTMVGNDGAELRGGLDDGVGGSGEDSATTQALGRSTMVRALGKFSAGNFDSLTAWVKAFGD